MELTKIVDYMEDIPWFNPQESANNNNHENNFIWQKLMLSMWKSCSYKTLKYIANVHVALYYPLVNKDFIILMYIILDSRK